MPYADTLTSAQVLTLTSDQADALTQGPTVATQDLSAIPVLPTSSTGWTNWTFTQRLAMLCQLFFGPAKEDGSQRTAYADDGTTVISTQTIGDDGTTQTQGRVP